MEKLEQQNSENIKEIENYKAFQTELEQSQEHHEKLSKELEKSKEENKELIVQLEAEKKNVIENEEKVRDLFDKVRFI